MLDTNMVGYLINQHSAVVRRVLDVSMASLCISSVTKGELIYGLAKRPEAIRLHRAIAEFLRRVDVLPWDRQTAASYGGLRAAMQRNGKTLASIDLLIAAHALQAAAVLVTNDKVFARVPGLGIEDWTA